MNLLSTMFETVAPVFEYSVVPLPGQPILLGFLVSRVKTDFRSPSGFSLHGPGTPEGQDGLLAQYPAQAEDLPAQKLDYE